MKKLFITICVLCFVGFCVMLQQDAVTYGVKYNPTSQKNEIYRANDDGTETFLIDFAVSFRRLDAWQFICRC